MICQYEWDNHACRNRYVQIRKIPLSNGNRIAAMLCDPHADVFDAIEWAEKRRTEDA